MGSMYAGKEAGQPCGRMKKRAGRLAPTDPLFSPDRAISCRSG